MKGFGLALLPLLANGSPTASATRAEKRQDPAALLKGLGMGNLAGLVSAKSPKVIDMPAKVRPGVAIRQRLLWGPFDFRPAVNASAGGGHSHSSGGTTKGDPAKGGVVPMTGMQMDPNGQVLLQRINGFCTDCTVLHGAAYVAHEDGSRVDVNEGAYLHHLLIMSPTKNNEPYYTCSTDPKKAPQKQKMSAYFLGSGVDESEYFFTTTDGKYNSGYYISPKDSFMMQSEIVNYSPTAKKWYIAADYEYVKQKPSGLEDVSVVDFNVNNCLGFLEAGYKPPNGEKKFAKTSPTFNIIEDGTILHAMGHLHDGGTNIDLMVNGKQVCSSKASYGGAKGTLINEKGEKWESISSMTTCRDPVPVKKGDMLTMKSVYDLDLHPLRESTNGQEMEEMGIYTLFFAPKGGAKVPTATGKIS